jgi:hypothetical protein
LKWSIYLFKISKVSFLLKIFFYLLVFQHLFVYFLEFFLAFRIFFMKISCCSFEPWVEMCLPRLSSESINPTYLLQSKNWGKSIFNMSAHSYHDFSESLVPAKGTNFNYKMDLWSWKVCINVRINNNNKSVSFCKLLSIWLNFDLKSVSFCKLLSIWIY